MEKKKNWWTIVAALTGFGCLLPVLLVVFIVVFVNNSMHTSASEVKSLVAQAKKVGLPFSAEEIDGPPVPDKDNAACDLQKLSRQLEMNRSSLDDVAQEWLHVRNSAASAARVNSFFSSNGAVVRQLQTAANKKALQLDLYYSPDDDLKPVVLLKSAVKLFAAKALVEAKAGQVENAYSHLSTAARLTREAGKGQTLISKLVCVASEAVTLNALGDVLSICGASPQNLARSRNVVGVLQQEPKMRDALEAEFYYLWNITEDPSTVRSYSSSAARDLQDPDKRRLAQSAVLTHFLELEKVFARHPDESDMIKIVDEARAADQAAPKPMLLSRATTDLLTQLTPSDALEGQALYRARLNCTLALLDVLAYRNTHHQWPTSLLSVSKHLTDPFTNRPLKLKTAGSSATVYSFGKDRHDNGGESSKAKTGGREKDLTVTYRGR